MDSVRRVARFRCTDDAFHYHEGDYYNPNEGYEPYWPDGEWVFELPRDRDLNASTTKWPLVCGEECIYLYTRIGKVCGHVSDDVTYYGCTASFCSGWYVDDLTGGFKTFDTYCNFLDVQCRNKFHSRLIFVHVGECLAQQDLWYKPMFTDSQPVSRFKSYMSSLSSVFANITATPFG
ncbi:hypothetical protein O3G_MSEX008033 [Manduca sexta]|uniref:Uncharacterized protein n=1 Tax=Manduca sexta TaxID=7130 RepID=A0A921Z9Y8_MANSE|nr:hypothetical protein O3G_MSEX008033 [Manduca sexta]